MPCEYYLPGEREALDAEELSKVTRVACTLCKFIESKGLEVPKDAQTWWKEHQKMDKQKDLAKREEIRQARIAQRARAKLTAAEKKALGI